AALGGDDFDHAIAEHFLKERAGNLGEKRLTSAEVKTALMSARLAKECLSSSTEGKWGLDVDGKQTMHALNRKTFEGLIEPLVKRTIDICRNVLDDAGVTPDEVSGVVLVGGSTRVPLVREMVATLFGAQPLSDIDPDEVVAVGAALQAEALTVGSDTLLLDVTPLSLGLETMGDMVEKVIPRNTPIPVAKAQEFTTYQDGQTAMMIHVVQGEREMATQCRSLARFALRGIPPLTAGAARIRVTFSVDADGLLTVSAEETTTGVAQHVEVKPSYGLSEDEMADMLRDSMVHAKDDMAARLLSEARVEGSRVLNAVISALRADGDLLDDQERGKVEGFAKALAEAIDGTDREVIDERVGELDRATQEFASRRMDRGINAALSGVAVDNLENKVS
ncbi:MAG: Hsp70 family protein, partial [Rhodospirillales bacterium]|nr:Hsp70 family protein [Rhodospirillales bacterium]